MFGELIFAICVLGVVIAGSLIMVQAITFDALVSSVGRLLLFVMMALVSACVLKMLVVSVVLPWLVSLKALFLWLVLVAIAVIALALVVRFTASKSTPGCRRRQQE